MNIIFQIDGGIGKSIMATAVCKAIKKQYPNDRLIVITGYPEVFLCNPNVYRTFNHAELRYFYRDFVEGQQIKMCVHNPYLETDFVLGGKHLIQIWCEMFGVTYNNELPELYINNREAHAFSLGFTSDKPIFVIQTNGGGPGQSSPYAWTRDLPQGLAQRIVNEFAPYYNVAHIRRQDQPALQNTVPVHANFRNVAVLIAMSQKRLLIDSFAQHTAAAIGMPSVVCWITNSPQQFGYSLHTNIMANPPSLEPELKFATFSKHNISGDPTEFCYRHEDEIFDFDTIMRALLPEAFAQPNAEPAAAGEASAPQPDEPKAGTTTEEETGAGRNRRNKRKEEPEMAIAAVSE